MTKSCEDMEDIIRILIDMFDNMNVDFNTIMMKVRDKHYCLFCMQHYRRCKCDFANVAISSDSENNNSSVNSTTDEEYTSSESEHCSEQGSEDSSSSGSESEQSKDKSHSDFSESCSESESEESSESEKSKHNSEEPSESESEDEVPLDLEKNKEVLDKLQELIDAYKTLPITKHLTTLHTKELKKYQNLIERAFLKILEMEQLVNLAWDFLKHPAVIIILNLQEMQLTTKEGLSETQ